MRRVAIIQTGAVHEEVVPSLIDALGANHRTIAWINQVCLEKRGDIFAEAPVSNTEIRYTTLRSRDDWDELARQIKTFDPSVVICATYQRGPLAEFAIKLGYPILGVIHNAQRVTRTDPVMTSFRSGAAFPLVLAPHVAAHFNEATAAAYVDQIGVVEPVYWGQPSKRACGAKRIAVPGGVTKANRDFDGLLRALTSDLAALLRRAGICIEILGGGPDRSALEKTAVQEGITDLLHFAPRSASGRVRYDVYLAALRRSWALLPLLPRRRRDYRSSKISSAIPTAIGCALPVILDRWTASVYQCPSIVAQASTDGALTRLAELSQSDRDELASAVLRHRDAKRAENRTEFSRMMNLAMERVS